METKIKQQPIELCVESSKKSRSNFLFAFRLLPKPRREALYAFYTFCREIDDTVDSQKLSTPEKLVALKRWRQEIDACYHGKPFRAATKVLAKYLQPFSISKEYLLEIINGVEMDVNKQRYESFSELYPYCYGVASAVGMVCTQIFGCRDPQSLKYAELLGVAFQLTNILRDIPADLSLNRIYIPGKEMQQCNYSEAELKKHTYNDAFVTLMQQQYERALAYYDRATDALPAADLQALLPARLMTRYYRSILNRIQRQRFQVFRRRITLPRSYKLFMLALYFPPALIAKWQKSRS